MSWGVSLVLVLSMIISVLVGGSTTSGVVIWGAMELNLLFFSVLMSLGQSWRLGSLSLMFFLTQSLSGLILLIMYLESGGAGAEYLLVAFCWMMLFKMGAFPFQGWVVFLGGKMPWWSLYVLLSLQKVLPLAFLKSLGLGSWGLLSIFAWGALGLLGLQMKNVKKLFILSSVFFLMILLSTMTNSAWKWKPYLILYSFMLAPLALLKGGSEKLSWSVMGLKKPEVVKWLLLLLSVSGIPPFSAFLFKMDFFLMMMAESQLVSMLSFGCGVVCFMYIYLSLTLSLVVEHEQTLSTFQSPGTLGGLSGCLLLSIWFFI